MTTETRWRSNILFRFVNRIRSYECRRLLRLLDQNAGWVDEVYSAPTLATWTEELARTVALANAEVTRR